MNLLPGTIEVLKDRMSAANDNRNYAEADNDPDVALEWAQVYDAISCVLADPTAESLRAHRLAMNELANEVDLAFGSKDHWDREDARAVRSMAVDLARAEFYGRTDPGAVVTGHRVSTIVVDGVRYDFGYPLRITFGKNPNQGARR